MKLPPLPRAAWAAQCSLSRGTEGGVFSCVRQFPFLLPHQHFLAGNSRSERGVRCLVPARRMLKSLVGKRQRLSPGG